MLNKLPNNQTTVEDNLLKSINAKLQIILAQKVSEDEVFAVTCRPSNSKRPFSTITMAIEDPLRCPSPTPLWSQS